MQCNINNVKRICGFNQAARYFEETKKPRTVKWGEDERPLYNTASYHYRIVKGEDNGVGFYDLVLYSTSMIRYYAPDSLGFNRVLVRGHSSTASRAFLWHHGMGMGRELNCMNEAGEVRNGRLLLNHCTEKATDHGVPYGWSADLLFTDSSLHSIYLPRSCHVPGYKAASSDEDKAKRKLLKTTVDHWIELLGYRLEEYLTTDINTNKWQRQRSGEAFTSALDLLSYVEADAIRESLKFVVEGGDTQFMERETFVNAMTQLGHAVATHLQGVRENQANMGWDYNTHKYIMGEIKPITRADFRKSMESHLVSLLGLRVGSARIDIGQFPASIPRKWWC